MGESPSPGLEGTKVLGKEQCERGGQQDGILDTYGSLLREAGPSRQVVIYTWLSLQEKQIMSFS